MNFKKNLKQNNDAVFNIDLICTVTVKYKLSSILFKFKYYKSSVKSYN